MGSADAPHCAACGHANRAGARFCLQCGAALPQACAACAHELPAGAAFCDACGAAVAEGPAPATRSPLDYTPRHLADRILHQRSALEGERKHVTVLFADLEGSTTLAEGIDPEEVHRLMDRAFQRMLAEVHRYEGTVNQFTGDGIMALFGAPVALEDAPVRAVRAALGIQRALQPLHEEQQAFGRAFRMRIGIHTGPVVVGRIGDDLRMDYTALGDTTNLAARLEQIAQPGGVVLSEDTRRLCVGFFDLRELGSQQVKGRSEPVEAFEVLGERPVASRIDALASVGLTPLVGRERELGDLDRAFDHARGGEGRVVLIAGDAGIGKSRLVHEFRQRLEGEPHIWFEGRCSTYTQTTAFHSLADGLRRAFDIDDRDADVDALAKVDRFCAEQDFDGGPFLRALLALPIGDPEVEGMDPVTRRSETVAVLQRLFERLTEVRPLVVVIEDLHWIDAASEDLLALLSERVPARRLLFVLTHRPGYKHPFGDRSFQTRIGVSTLSAPEMGEMARTLLATKALPPGLRARIVEKAEGNPLFVEEVTKSLLEEGVIVRREDGVALRTGIEDVAIPDRIQDVLMARIDRLAEEPKRAIQCASVIGREFALRLLEHTAGLSEAVAEIVEDLRSLEFVYEKTRHPELAFIFKHALTREVAYESVLLDRRRRMHRAVGAAIEELYPDRLAEHYETLADHFTVGEDWERAFRYHAQASEKAAASYANQSVTEHCTKALALARQLEEAPSSEMLSALELRLGFAEQALSNFTAGGEAYLRAAEQAATVEDRAMNLARGAFSLLWGHDYERAREAASDAIALGREHDLPAACSMGLMSEDEQSLVEQGRLLDTKMDEMRDLAEASGNREALSMAYTQIAQRQEMRGNYPAAIDYCTRAIEAARGDQLEVLTMMPAWILGLALTCTGRYDRAIREFRQALEVCERLGDRAVRARMLNTLGFCYAEIGCHDVSARFNLEGTKLAHEMVELGLVPGAPELHANAAVNLAGNRVALGHLDDAIEYVDPVRQHLDEPGDPWMRWRYALHVKDVVARWHLANREPEMALALAGDELAGAREHGARKLEARALELQGRVLVGLDHREEAGGAVGEALALARELGYPPIVWRALSLRAELARRAGDREAADRDAQEARALVERLARRLEDGEVRMRFGSLGEALVVDPLGAYR